MTNARRTAALALVKQEQNGYSNLVLAAALEREALSPRDKAFVSALLAAAHPGLGAGPVPCKALEKAGRPGAGGAALRPL